MAFITWEESLTRKHKFSIFIDHIFKVYCYDMTRVGKFYFLLNFMIPVPVTNFLLL